MTVKEHLQQVIAELTEQEASDVLTLVAAAKAGATPVDVYGTPWGSVLTGVDPDALVVTGKPSIELPDGIPNIE
ncbi:MAG: hypothetical protein QM679_05240 [Patulibacter sp.]